MSVGTNGNDYRGYLAAIEELTTLTERSGEQRRALENEAARRLSAVDVEWTRADQGLRRLSDRRSSAQRAVVGLCREVGVSADQSPAGAATFRSPSEIEAALADVGRGVDEARRDWDWAQRHRERARTAAAAPPPQAPTVVAAPAPAPLVAPEPATSRYPAALMIGLGVAVLIIVVLVVALAL